MKTRIGAAIVTAALAVGGPAGKASAAAAALKPTMQTANSQSAADFSAGRYPRRHDRHGYGPHYYDRPYYYRPYPYAVPAPFLFGFGFGPRLW